MEHYLRDELKSPFGCNAKPAFVSKPSLNLYFGMNVRGNDEDDFVMERTAYAIGTGINSIGLDPRTLRINPFFPRLVDLTKSIQNLVREKTIYKEFEINFVSVKVYYWFHDKKGQWVKKDTNWHNDITLDQKGRPCPNNSQLPGSPVGILTFGAPKKLYLRKGRSKTDYNPETFLEIPQNSGSFFLLDGRDELLDEKGKRWAHKSSSVQTPTGVTFSLMFRQVQKRIGVSKFTGCIANAKVGPKKLLQFEKGKKILNTPYYKKEHEAIDGKIRSVFSTNQFK